MNRLYDYEGSGTAHVSSYRVVENCSLGRNTAARHNCTRARYSLPTLRIAYTTQGARIACLPVISLVLSLRLSVVVYSRTNSRQRFCTTSIHEDSIYLAKQRVCKIIFTDCCGNRYINPLAMA